MSMKNATRHHTAIVPFFLVPCMVTKGLSIQSQGVQADITHNEGNQWATPTILREAGCGCSRSS